MEYSVDILISFVIFSVAVSIVSVTITGSIVATLTVQFPTAYEIKLPNHLEILALNEGYLVKSLRKCLVHVIILKSRNYVLIRGLTPLKVIAKPSDWIIAFTYTSIAIKIGTPIQSRFIVSMYGVVEENLASKPYVIIEGTSYKIVPNFKLAQEAPSNTSAYSILNNTIVLKVRE